MEERLESLQQERDRLALLEAILARAERRFRDEHQPPVLQRASAYLERVTHGRWRRLDFEEGADGGLFVAGSGRDEPVRVAPPLSRGTLDQIFLCLRLGLLDHLDEGRERLPLVLDDALLRMDAVRRAAVYELLAEISRRRQVFLLTCQEWIAAEAEHALKLRAHHAARLRGVPMPLPEKGIPKDELLARMRERKRADADWRGGRTFSLVYPAGEDVDEVLREAAELYLFENALNPFRFPSLRQMEDDVVALAADLLHGGPRRGRRHDLGRHREHPDGGEDGARARARRARRRRSRRWWCPSPRIRRSRRPRTTWASSCARFRCARISVRTSRAAAKLINDEHGARRRLGAELSVRRGRSDPRARGARRASAASPSTPIRVSADSCCRSSRRWASRSRPSTSACPGVSTLSADVHKYGYCIKGASVILHRDKAHLNQHQLFLWDRWPGGTYGSFAMAGARPSAPIAAAWAVLHYLGRDGYLRLAREVRDTTRKLRAGIDAIPGLRVLGEPVMSVLAFGSDRFDVFAVGDAMDARGWHLDRQKGPAALHLMVSPMHAKIADAFLADLREAARAPGESKGAAIRYS